ncbi:MAG: NAD-dependent succinate-semialdehyde dehydrogenase [Bradyrhizobium sp.]|nr:MAG: NAD-dependent succinate-semialdehyde dehydrogenase [Bradyrhizobium sp.]
MLKLQDPSLLRDRAYISGQWSDAASRTPVRNPANGELIAEVADVGVAGARAAIDAAQTALGPWAARTARERSLILAKWSQLLLDNAEDLGSILTAEMGKPLAEAKGEIAYGASFIEWFGQEARRLYGDVIPGHQADKRILVLRQPIGVAASITPWNFPNAMIARKVAPALAAGCAFVARPSELTPLSALAMAVLAERAGVPAGVFNVVTSADAAGVGLEFCVNPKVRKISFTGSTRVGAILMRQSADGIKKLSLELGGNAPFIVFDDADIDKAVEGVLIAKFRNSGQTCVCANRIYVQRGVYDAFAAKLATAVAALKVGDGVEPGVQIGPLISPAALAKVEAHVADALHHGAEARVGGRRSAAGALFYEPTLLTGANADMRLAREETFGPVAPLFAFDTVEEVIAMANDTEFGLASYFYARDLSRVWKVAEALEYGMVGVNTGLISTAEAPFGGVKSSGFGREGSKYGIDDYVTMKYVCLSV